MKTLKKAFDYYKQLRIEEKQRKALINSNADFTLLEQLIQKMNVNSNLGVEIYLNDGSRILIKTHNDDINRKDVYDDNTIVIR